MLFGFGILTQILSVCDKLLKKRKLTVQSCRQYGKTHYLDQTDILLFDMVALGMRVIQTHRELLCSQVVSQAQIKLKKHADWAEGFAERLKGRPREEIRSVLEQEVGKVFVSVLEDAGVYKRDDGGKEAFRRFIKTI